MQSGITASQDLIKAFNKLVSDPSQLALLATIENETLTPSTTIAAPSTSFPASLSALTPHLQPNQALYILLRTDPSTSIPNPFAVVTYVPDHAPVRQKTLYASTRLTLVRELGVERFSESLFVTDKSELGPAGWEAHVRHSQAEGPLTDREREERTLREAEAGEASGASRRGAGYGDQASNGGNGSAGGAAGGARAGGGKLALRVGDGVEEAIRSVKDAVEGRLVFIKIDPASETLLVDASHDSVSPADLAASISSTEPRYTFYRYAAPGASDTKTLFLYTCPSNSKIKERMMYASSRARLISIAEADAGLTIDKKLEGSNPDEFTEDVLAKEFEVQKEESKGFARPKRPGRR